MRKRTWIYIQSPKTYEIFCDKCGGVVEWSEFEGMVWCPKCKIDTKGSPSIFSGPIPLEAMQLLGVSFDRLDLRTKERLYMHLTKKGDRLIWRRKKNARI